MAANNEIGNIYPIEAIGEIAKQYNTPFLCDVSQAVGKIPTLNVPGIVGLGEACRLRQLEMTIDETAIAQKRDRLQSLLLKEIPGLIINGDLPNRLAGNLHISIPDIPRIGIGKFTTDIEIEQAAEILTIAIQSIRDLMR
jgi:cysteine desulfurase